MLCRKIELDGTKVYKLRKALSQDPAQHPLIKHGQSVHKVEIRRDKECNAGEGEGDDDKYKDIRSGGAQFTREELIQLLKKLPNPKIFDMARRNFSHLYMEYMQDIDSSQHLTRLEEIIMHEGFIVNEENDRNAFKTYLKFRSTLTRLNLPYYDGTLYEIDGESSDALEFLLNFDKL